MRNRSPYRRYKYPPRQVLKKVIDYDVLKAILSNNVVEGAKERYQFTWPDKSKARALANLTPTSTLRPCREESVNFDTTENLYIEGDNFEVLKVLHETYMGKIKMIYIDPPYNTGKDFVYKDDFSQVAKQYKETSNQYDEQGNRLFVNTESNGRFHTDWLNMMYPRLKVARELLTEDGAIFISITDKESANLKKICEELFGSINFVADLVWANKEGGGSSDSKLFRIKHEHILCYAKNINELIICGVTVNNEARYKSQDDFVKTRGKYYLQKMGMGTIQYSPSLDYPIEAPDGSLIMPKDNNSGRKACWRWSKQKYEWGLVNGFIEIRKDSNGIWTVYTKQYLNCDNEGNIIDRTQRPMGIIEDYSSIQASKLLSTMNMDSFFDYAKPIELISYLIERMNDNNYTILDFFSGSATTAHAVMKQNAEDGGKRRFIMVQLPEKCKETSEAYKAGYKNICEIGKERIRRTGKQIIEELRSKNGDLFSEEESLDIGFRDLKIDSSNMNDVELTPDETSKDDLEGLISNIKADRSPEDILFEVMLKKGILLSSKIETETINGKKVFNVNNSFLIACFDRDVNDDVITEVAKKHPVYFVMRDDSLANDSTSVNFDQIFERYSPNTTREVL